MWYGNCRSETGLETWLPASLMLPKCVLSAGTGKACGMSVLTYEYHLIMRIFEEIA